jgi:hypothetical protein
MTERDPVDHLTAAERPEHPDPQFAARLIDSLLSDLDTEAHTAGAPMVEVVQLHEDNPMNTPSPRLRWALLAAAATIIVVVGLVSLVSNDDNNEILDTPSPTAGTSPTTEPPAATSVPTTSPTTEPAATTAAPTSSPLDPAEAAWQEIPPMLFAGVTGEYRTNTFGVPFKFDTGDMAHTKTWEREDWIAISNDEVPGWIDVFTGLDSIDATIEEFQAMHEAVESAQMDEPEPATLAGAEGVVFRSVGLPPGVGLTEQDLYEFTAPIPDRGVWTDSSAYGVATPGMSSPGSDGVSIWVIDVNGQIVVVAQSALDMQMTADVHTRSREATRSLINSISWKDLS